MSQSKNTNKIFGGIEIMNFIDSNNKRLLNIASPQADYDGVNKLYVDTIVQDLTLLPGDSMNDPAFGAEYSNSNYNIVFDGLGSNNLTVKRKKYLKQVKID